MIASTTAGGMAGASHRPSSAHRREPVLALADLGAALAQQTILPAAAGDRGLRAAWAWPLAGFGVALAAAIIGWILLQIGMVPGVAAAAVLAVLAILTGARHEAGVASSADGLFGRGTSADRVRLMESRQPGSHGVVALVLTTLARWAALVFLIGAGKLFVPLLTATLLAYAAVPLAMIALAPAAGPLTATAAHPPRVAAAIGLVVALVLTLVGLGWAIFAAVAAAGVTAVALALFAHIRVGGQTAPILAAMQQLSELAVLAALCAAL